MKTVLKIQIGGGILLALTLLIEGIMGYKIPAFITAWAGMCFIALMEMIKQLIKPEQNEC